MNELHFKTYLTLKEDEAYLISFFPKTIINQIFQLQSILKG